ncbi:MAG: caspase family protein [Elusimicrobia bacterium]|nr:caspase family protein [Elusimicrobiota bacterium]
MTTDRILRGGAGFLALWLAGALAPPAGAAEPLLLTATGHMTAVTAAAFSPDGRRMLSGSLNILNLWDAATGRELAAWQGHDGWVRAVAFSPDGRKAVSAGDDKVIRLWDLEAGGRPAAWEAGVAIRALAFSPDGKRVLSGGADKAVTLRDASTGGVLASWKGHSWNVNAVAFSPDGRTGVSGSLDMSLRLWDAASGRELAQCLGHSAEVLSVAFSPDGKSVLSGSVDNTVRLWEAGTCKALAVWEGHRKWVNAVAFSPDGRTAVSGSRDQTVKLWDTATGNALATWKGHINSVNAVAFAPDGMTAVSGSDDETLKFWRVPSAWTSAGAIPKPKAFPKLKAQVAFVEPSGNDMLEGEEKGSLRVAVANAGPGPAYALRVLLDLEPVPGLSVPRSVELGQLGPGQSAVKDIAIEASDSLVSGKARIKVEVREGNGFDAEPQVIEFETRPFVAPRLEVAGVALGGSGVVKAGEVTQVTVVVRNGGGPARQAVARLAIADPDIFLSGDASVALGDVGPGESRKAEFQFVVNNRFKGRSLPVSLALTESLGKYGAEAPLNLVLGEAAPSLRVVTVKGKEGSPVLAAQAPQEDVDSPPEAKTEIDPEAYAVVIGIEKYRQKGIPPVDFAARDAQSMHRYLTRAMGFDEKNVILLQNDEAGKTDLEKYLGPWLRNRVTKKSRVFIFYAGHGAPNPETGEGYLIPYDGDPNYTDIAAYPIKALYDGLARLQAKSVAVVLDACFSGQGTRSLLAKGTRPLVTAVKNEAGLGANTVVLTATGGAQISTFFQDGQHGLLTYYLLKGLKGAADADKDGLVTTLELFSYVKPMVEREARKQNVSQTPTLTPEPSALGDRAGQVWLRAR